ncbi:glucokinase [Colwelliaceae bacterium 6441]
MQDERSQVYLVADIGGTNIRIAQTDKARKLFNVSTYRCENFSSLSEVLLEYINSYQLNDGEIHACLAIACPTDNDHIAMTNLPWQFSQKALKKALSLESLVFINDYTAIALSIPYLTANQKVKIGCGDVANDKSIVVCGPGTGLGVATLIPMNANDNIHWHCVNSEGGHIDFAPVDEIDIELLRYLSIQKKRVSYEQFLSGYGLVQIYQGLINTLGDDKNYDTQLTAADISERAITSQCGMCKAALLQFCKILGSFAGNLALINSSLGGVYIAGGIVPRFIEFIKKSEFRDRFEAKGRLSGISKATATFVITEPQPGLLGAAVHLNQQL